MTLSDLAIETMTIMSQLEVLCEAESSETSSKGQKRQRRQSYSNTFDTQASLLQDRLTRLVKKHPEARPSLQKYLEETGLATLYPRATHYIAGVPVQGQAPKKGPMDGYLAHLAVVNQVNVLCKQLHHDVQKLNNHKYLAHQVALLYQSLNQLGNVKALLSYRSNIEGMFKKMKAALELTGEGDSVPHLPDEYKTWLLDLTVSLREVMSSFNPSFNQPLLPAISFLQQTH
ncbi:uncharacterized protein [Diadema antillarum]|uniref:uncharacterized protein n=1 Tax=Diadema antillarum TaxID=105358 RepID=UPI003A869E50